MKVYVAGKFYGTPDKHYDRDWRNDIVGDEESMEWPIDDRLPLKTQWRSRAEHIRGKARGGHDYIGPFKSDCGGHGQGQGATDHGSGASANDDGYGPVYAWPSNRRQEIVNACIDAIGQADLFYAWLDRFDAFGTIAEIGYAAAVRDASPISRPYISIACPSTIDPHGELWFCLKLANNPVKTASPIEGYDSAVYWAATAFRNLRPHRRAIPRSLRWVILEKFNYTCQYCNRRRHSSRHDPDGNPWHVDHAIPLARGGADGPENLTLACQACNLRKGAR